MKFIVLIFALLLSSCVTAGVKLPLPVRPLEPTIKWVHAPARDNIPAGELLTYEEFRRLALWLVETRAYQHELENQLLYYRAKGE
ncbi:MAG: hypothetical protein HKM05_07175 [Spirochaetales bacterium]|nr:hypothetical protein [Spirochaetales bacterium]